MANTNILNLGNDKLNINTTTAKGLEKAIGVIGKFILKAQSSINKIFYGEFKLQNDPEANKIQKAIDKGISNTLSDLVGINYCDIINSLLTPDPNSDKQRFDPNNEPNASQNPLERTKWQIQKAAFETQKLIDQYYQSYSNLSNSESRAGLYTLIQEINSIVSTILGPEQGLRNPDLQKTFFQLSIAATFFEDVLGKLNQFPTVNSITPSEFQKLLRLVEKIRSYCAAIIALDSPAAFLNLADNIAKGGVQEQIANLNKMIDVPRFIPLIKQIIILANNINTIGRKLLGYINLGRIIIKICIAVIKIFNVLKKFFLANPIPSLFGTKGLDIQLNNIFQKVLTDDGDKKLVKRLNQINAVLNLMAICVTTLLAGIQDIITKLTLIKLNLESCNPELGKEIDDTINNLVATRDQLQQFIDQYNSSDERLNAQFGEYTIDIVTEEVTDEGIRLKRRFGVARDRNNYIVAQSTPTFASLDLIIFNEVKALLVSKGLVNIGISSISPDSISTVLESLKYLGEEDLSTANINLLLQDIPGLKEEADALGLNTFINNLPGGKALRKRVQQMMAERSAKLKTDLSNTDPLGRFTSGITG